jgi:hypothetical protein
MAGNIVELVANQNVDGQNAFTQSFAPTAVDELLLEFDPKHSGPPIVKLSGEGGAAKEIHPLPQRGREGRFSAHLGGDAKWSSLSVTMARNTKGRLVKVRLIVKSHAATPGAPTA